jgi:hypothetical protein
LVPPIREEAPSSFEAADMDARDRLRPDATLVVMLALGAGVTTMDGVVAVEDVVAGKVDVLGAATAAAFVVAAVAAASVNGPLAMLSAVAVVVMNG